ncbi:hypothetical protein NUU35_25665, partial [Escherichia coli]|nr:hypothetical protein [Escherichia coli]
TQPATGETYPKSDLFNKAKSMMITFDNISQYLNASRLSLDLKK